MIKLLNKLRRFGLILFLLLLPSIVMLGADKNFTLVIDAGHGGKDSGAQGVISKEKDINLNVDSAYRDWETIKH